MPPRVWILLAATASLTACTAQNATVSWNCSFEDQVVDSSTETYCSTWWTTPLPGQVYWTWRTGAGSWSTGPTAAYHQTYYLIMDTGSCFTSAQAVLSSMQLNLTSISTLSFWYHMWGSTVQHFVVQVNYGDGFAQADTVWSESGNQGDKWNRAYVNLAAYAEKTVIVKFLGNCVAPGGDIAIDAVNVTGVLASPGLQDAYPVTNLNWDDLDSTAGSINLAYVFWTAPTDLSMVSSYKIYFAFDEQGIEKWERNSVFVGGNSVFFSGLRSNPDIIYPSNFVIVQSLSAEGVVVGSSSVRIYDTSTAAPPAMNFSLSLQEESLQGGSLWIGHATWAPVSTYPDYGFIQSYQLYWADQPSGNLDSQEDLAAEVAVGTNQVSLEHIGDCWPRSYLLLYIANTNGRAQPPANASLVSCASIAATASLTTTTLTTTLTASSSSVTTTSHTTTGTTTTGTRTSTTTTQTRTTSVTTTYTTTTKTTTTVTSTETITSTTPTTTTLTSTTYTTMTRTTTTVTSTETITSTTPTTTTSTLTSTTYTSTTRTTTTVTSTETITSTTPTTTTSTLTSTTYTSTTRTTTTVTSTQTITSTTPTTTTSTSTTYTTMTSTTTTVTSTETITSTTPTTTTTLTSTTYTSTTRTTTTVTSTETITSTTPTTTTSTSTTYTTMTRTTTTVTSTETVTSTTPTTTTIGTATVTITTAGAASTVTVTETATAAATVTTASAAYNIWGSNSSTATTTAQGTNTTTTSTETRNTASTSTKSSTTTRSVSTSASVSTTTTRTTVSATTASTSTTTTATHTVPTCAPPESPPGGSYDCGANATLLPLGTVCRLLCNEQGATPDPPFLELQCAYTTMSNGVQTLLTEDQAIPADVVPAFVPVRCITVNTRAFCQVHAGGPQVCRPVVCPLPFAQGVRASVGAVDVSGPDLALLGITCTGLSQGATCEPACGRGSLPSGQLECTASGRFEGKVACEPQVCQEEPTWQFGDTGSAEANCSGRLHSQTCAVVCADGYEQSTETALQPPVFTCEEGVFTFSGQEPPCGLLNCTALPEVKCPPNSVFLGNFTCDQGTWRSTGQGCVAEEATVSNQRVTSFSLLLAVTRPDASPAETALALALSTPGTQAQDAVLSVAQDLLSQGLSSEEVVRDLLRAAIAVGLSTSAAVAASVALALQLGSDVQVMGANIAELALSGGGDVSSIITSVAAALVAADASNAASASLLQACLDALSVRVQVSLQIRANSTRGGSVDVATAGLAAGDIARQEWMASSASGDLDIHLLARRSIEAALLGGLSQAEAESLAAYAVLAAQNPTLRLPSLDAARNTPLLAEVAQAANTSAALMAVLPQLVEALLQRLPSDLAEALPQSALAVALGAGLPLSAAARLTAAVTFADFCPGNMSDSCFASAAQRLGAALGSLSSSGVLAAQAAAAGVSPSGNPQRTALVAALAATAASPDSGAAAVQRTVGAAAVSVGIRLTSAEEEAAVRYALASQSLVLVVDQLVRSQASSVSPASLGVLTAMLSGAPSADGAGDAVFAALFYAGNSTAYAGRLAAAAAARAAFAGLLTQGELSWAEAALSTAVAALGDTAAPGDVAAAVAEALAGARPQTVTAATYIVLLQAGYSQTAAAIAALSALVPTLQPTSVQGRAAAALLQGLQAGWPAQEMPELLAGLAGAPGVLEAVGQLLLAVGLSAQDLALVAAPLVLGLSSQSQVDRLGLAARLAAAAAVAMGSNTARLPDVVQASTIALHASSLGRQAQPSQQLLSAMLTDFARAQPGAEDPASAAASAFDLVAYQLGLGLEDAALAAAAVRFAEQPAWATQAVGLIAATRPLSTGSWPGGAAERARNATAAVLAGLTSAAQGQAACEGLLGVYAEVCAASGGNTTEGVRLGAQAAIEAAQLLEDVDAVLRLTRTLLPFTVSTTIVTRAIAWLQQRGMDPTIENMMVAVGDVAAEDNSQLTARQAQWAVFSVAVEFGLPSSEAALVAFMMGRRRGLTTTDAIVDAAGLLALQDPLSVRVQDVANSLASSQAGTTEGERAAALLRLAVEASARRDLEDRPRAAAWLARVSLAIPRPAWLTARQTALSSASRGARLGCELVASVDTVPAEALPFLVFTLAEEVGRGIQEASEAGFVGPVHSGLPPTAAFLEVVRLLFARLVPRNVTTSTGLGLATGPAPAEVCGSAGRRLANGTTNVSLLSAADVEEIVASVYGAVASLQFLAAPQHNFQPLPSADPSRPTVQDEQAWLAALLEGQEDALIQALAEALGVPPEYILVSVPDSSLGTPGVTEDLLGLVGATLTVLITDSGEVPFDEIQSRVASLGDRSSDVFTKFAQALQQGLQLPPFVVFPGKATVDDQFPLAASVWISGEWDACNTVCGEGQLVRNVRCSTHNTAACDQNGPRPVSIEPCEDYSDCPWDPLCPMNGRGSELDCGLQQGIALGFISCAVLSVLIPCSIMCWRRCRKPVQGQAEIKLLEKQVTWHLEHSSGQEDSNVVDALQEKGPTKFHIIWDIGPMLEELQCKLNKGPEEEDEEDVDSCELPDDGELPEPMPGRSVSLDLILPRDERQDFLRLRLFQLEEAVPMYQDGDDVEYFSMTHQCWNHGKVRLSLTQHGSKVKGRLRAAYDIQVRTQTRHDVPLDLLRLPLILGEEVQLFAKYGGRREHWMPAIVAGKQPSVGSLQGYSVRIYDREQRRVRTIRKVSAVQLRRRYHLGQEVEVYRGPPVGWEWGVVEAVPDNQYPAPLTPGSPKPALPDAVELEGQSLPSVMHPWSMVKMRFPSQEHEGEEGRVEDVPSYLLRKTRVVVVPFPL